MTLKLIGIINAKHREVKFPDLDEVYIGRAKNLKGIIISDPCVSRIHCVIKNGEGYSILDLGSKNGTYVNGERISSETRLQHGDELNIANRYRFQVGIE